MRRMRLFLFLSATLPFVIGGCGGTSGNMGFTSNRSITGNWTAMATANTTSMGGMMPSPMLSFTFTMTESAMMMNSPGASVTVSNLNFMAGNNCFDNMAMATAMVAGAMGGGNRTLTLQLSENGNTAMFSMAVPSDNNSAKGNFALTGGNMMRGSAVACVATASGTAVFSRM